MKFLLKEGADINALDNKRRTLLIKDALWSCVKIVDTLVNASANTKIQDKQGRQAVDFAKESERNNKERHKRHTKYNKDPFIKKRYHKLI